MKTMATEMPRNGWGLYSVPGHRNPHIRQLTSQPDQTRSRMWLVRLWNYPGANGHVYQWCCDYIQNIIVTITLENIVMIKITIIY